MGIHNSDFYKRQGFVSANAEDSLRLIKDIAETFGVPLTGPGGIRRGFNWLGGASCPNQANIFLWWPAPSNETGGWGNEFNDDDTRIIETNASHEDNRQHIEEWIADGRDRAVFKKESQRSIGTYYRFIGIFRVNKAESRRASKLVWERVKGVDRLEVK